MFCCVVGFLLVVKCCVGFVCGKVLMLVVKMCVIVYFFYGFMSCGCFITSPLR